MRVAEPLETSPDSQSADPSPQDQAISREEEAILWRSLERIPENYREPLVLFYREHQSIENVATALELSEDVVKQRLSRGRKLLHEQVLAFVEGALERSNPGKAFTLTVVAALSGITLSAQAASLGVAAAKSGAAAKSAGALGLLAAICSPLLIVFGNYLGYRIGIDEARTDEERQFIKSFYRRILVVTAGLTTILAMALLFLRPPHFSNAAIFTTVFIGAVIFYLLAVLVNMFGTNAKRQQHFSRILAVEHGGVFPKPAFEYRSQATFLGLPLIHIRIGDRFDVLQKPVKGWIAMGNYAIGGLFAFGGLVIAPFGVGFCVLGLMPFAGIAIGLVPLGGIALGGWTYGGLAIGWQSMGCFAIALHTAAGNIALARDYAMGNLAFAAHVNAAVITRTVLPDWYSKGGEFLQRYSLWMNFLWIAPLFIQSRIVARQKSRTAALATST